MFSYLSIKIYNLPSTVGFSTTSVPLAPPQEKEAGAIETIWKIIRAGRDPKLPPFSFYLTRTKGTTIDLNFPELGGISNSTWQVVDFYGQIGEHQKPDSSKDMQFLSVPVIFTPKQRINPNTPIELAGLGLDGNLLSALSQLSD